MPPRKDFALSTAEKMDARAAIAALEGSGLSLEEAVRRAMEGKRSVQRITIQDACDQFLKTRLATVRASTAGWYEASLNLFCGHFGATRMDDLTRAEFRAWMQQEGQGAGVVRAVRALYNWAIAHEPALAGQDVTAGMASRGTRSAEIHYLPVDECAAIMAGAGKYRSSIALMLFAGVRPDEVASEHKPALLWRHVNLAERIIRIPPDIAKTGRARIMEGLPDTVWEWLEPNGKDKRVCPVRSLQAIRLAQSIAGYNRKIGRRKPRKWPHDALRHTFATYHVAAFANPGQTAMLMGHEGNPTMLHRHYRGLATKAEADKFWALRP